MNDKKTNEVYKLSDPILIEKEVIREAYKLFIKEIEKKEDEIKDWLATSGMQPTHVIREYKN